MSVAYEVEFDNNGTRQQTCNAWDCLVAAAQAAVDCAGLTEGECFDKWLNGMSYEQHQEVQDVIDDCAEDTDDVHLLITYPEPTPADNKRVAESRAAADSSDCDYYSYHSEEPCGSTCASGDIPTVSDWGLILLAVLALAAGIVALKRRRTIQTI